jgi:hypothetical protein
MSCRCSKEALSFDRGFLRLKESKKFGIWRGSRNSQVWSNATCCNVADPIDNAMYGYLWNDSSGKQQTFWALKVGYLDVNAALAAVAQASDFEIAVDEEVLNGIPCFQLSWSGHRLWVDENNFARVLRWESDYSDGTLARSEYDEWTTVEAVQLPMKLSFELFYDSGKYSWRRFDFILSEVNVGAEVDDAYFVIWIPPDTGQVQVP